VCAWSIKGKVLKRFETRPHRIGVTSVAYSSDGKQVISVCHGGEIVHSDAETGVRILIVIAKGAAPVTADTITTPALVLSDDGQRLAGRLGLKTKEINPNLHVWDTSNGDELSGLPGFGGILRKNFVSTTAVRKMAFQSDGSLVTCAEI
jgi:WD40 repeat protein